MCHFTILKNVDYQCSYSTIKKNQHVENMQVLFTKIIYHYKSENADWLFGYALCVLTKRFHTANITFWFSSVTNCSSM